MSKTNNNNKQFNLTIGPLYKLPSGLLGSILVTPQMFDALQHVKVGGKFFVKETKSKSNDKSPDAYLEYMSPEQIQKFKAERQEAELKGDSL